jgi:hypothetical protein
MLGERSIRDPVRQHLWVRYRWLPVRRRNSRRHARARGVVVGGVSRDKGLRAPARHPGRTPW